MMVKFPTGSQLPIVSNYARIAIYSMIPLRMSGGDESASNREM